MKPFTRNELAGIGVILLVIILVSILNLKVALRRARDTQRRADLGAICGALNNYSRDFGFFPPSQDGKIKACKGENFDTEIAKIVNQKPVDIGKIFEILRPCVWGKDNLVDLFDPKFPAYLEIIPNDPKLAEGISYLYFSNEKRYQIYTYLEGGADETGYNKDVAARNLACGGKICNFGMSYGETPLDKSIEEYENELLEKSKIQNPSGPETPEGRREIPNE